jgi:hypothetical protein
MTRKRNVKRRAPWRVTNAHPLVHRARVEGYELIARAFKGSRGIVQWESEVYAPDGARLYIGTHDNVWDAKDAAEEMALCAS